MWLPMIALGLCGPAVIGILARPGLVLGPAFVQQVRPIPPRLLPSGVLLPGRVTRVIARHQHVGDADPPVGPRSRVVRMVEQAVLERLRLERFLVPYRPRHQPNDGLEQRERRRLTTGQHEVRNGALLRTEDREDALVDALVPTADEHEPRFSGELSNERLVQAPTGW